MSKTTTCIPAITKVSGISEGTVNKLYNAAGIEQPMATIEKPVPYHHIGCVIEAYDTMVLASMYTKYRDDTDIVCTASAISWTIEYSIPESPNDYTIYTDDIEIPAMLRKARTGINDHTWRM